MTAPYIPSQSGWKPRKPATDLLTSTLGNRFGGAQQEQPSAPAAPWMQPQQPQQPAQPAPSPYAPQPARGAPATAPAPSAPVNPFRAQPASSLAPPTPQPGTPPNSGAPTAPQPTNPYTPPPLTPSAPPNTPAMPATPAGANGITTNPDGSRSFGAYTVDAYGRVINSPYHADLGQGATQYNWGAYGTGENRAEGFNRLTAEDYAAIAALDPEGAKMWQPNAEGGYDYNPNAAADASGVRAPQPPKTNPGGPSANQPGQQGYSMFGADPELDALVKAGLAQPSRFDNDLVTSMWNSRAGDIDTEYDQANRGLSENLARRGIRDSTFGGEKQQHLAGERRSAKSRALQSLAEDIAGTMSTDRSRAISDAMSLRSQATGERQFGQNFGLAERFGVDDRAYRNRESDWQHGFQTETFNAGRQDSADDLYKWLVQQGLI